MPKCMKSWKTTGYSNSKGRSTIVETRQELGPPQLVVTHFDESVSDLCEPQQS